MSLATHYSYTLTKLAQSDKRDQVCFPHKEGKVKKGHGYGKYENCYL